MIKITIKTGIFAEAQVDATIYGQLAVHRAHYNPHVWAVTHIATGYAIEYDMTMGAAFDVASELQRLGFDFDAYAANGYKDDTPLLQEAIACAKKWRGF